MVTVQIEPYEESLKILPASEPDRVMITARRNGELVGHLCLTSTKGAVFGHDTKCWDEDKHTALRMWFFARKFLRTIGVDCVYVHVNPGDTVQASFWETKGFKKVTEIYKGNI